MTGLRLVSGIFVLLLFAQTPQAQVSPARMAAWDKWLDIRKEMREQIARLDAYTCIQNISRFEQVEKNDPRHIDTIRMQVTASKGSESFSWPGSPNAVASPRDLLQTGLLGTGLFSGYVHSLFVDPGPTHLELIGADTGDARELLHFRFVFDAIKERMIVRNGAGRASVRAKGEFWVNPDDRLLRRLLIENAEPAPEINVRQVRYLLDWAPVKTGSGMMLLPQNAEVALTFYSGETHRNDISLSQCREFLAESSLRFDATPGEPAPAETQNIAIPAGGFLPEGLIIPMRLTTPVDVRTAAVGDVFLAEVTRDVKRKSDVLVSAGAIAEGRVRRLERYDKPVPHTLLWLEFSILTDGSTEYVFLAELLRRDGLLDLVSSVQSFTEGAVRAKSEFGGYRVDHRETLYYPAVPGVGSFLFRGAKGILPVGYGMDWKTIAARSDTRN